MNIATTIDSIIRPTITYACSSSTASCGCSAEDVELSSAKIIDAQEAVAYSWTMVVSIRLNNSEQHSCGGSILTESYILTAAHCVENSSVKDIRIAAGMHNLIEDYFMIRHVIDMHIYPTWGESDGIYQNDIALLEIFPPLPVSSNRRYAQICVPHISSRNETLNYPSNSNDLVIVGWGSTQYGSNNISETLQQTRAYLIDNNDSVCLKSIHDVETQFCAELYGRGSEYRSPY